MTQTQDKKQCSVFLSMNIHFWLLCLRVKQTTVQGHSVKPISRFSVTIDTQSSKIRRTENRIRKSRVARFLQLVPKCYMYTDIPPILLTFELRFSFEIVTSSLLPFQLFLHATPASRGGAGSCLGVTIINNDDNNIQLQHRRTSNCCCFTIHIIFFFFFFLVIHFSLMRVQSLAVSLNLIDNVYVPRKVSLRFQQKLVVSHLRLCISFSIPFFFFFFFFVFL